MGNHIARAIAIVVVAVATIVSAPTAWASACARPRHSEIAFSDRAVVVYNLTPHNTTQGPITYRACVRRSARTFPLFHLGPFPPGGNVITLQSFTRTGRYLGFTVLNFYNHGGGDYSFEVDVADLSQRRLAFTSGSAADGPTSGLGYQEGIGMLVVGRTGNVAWVAKKVMGPQATLTYAVAGAARPRRPGAAVAWTPLSDFDPTPVDSLRVAGDTVAWSRAGVTQSATLTT